MNNINPMTDKRKATREKLLACARELFDELGFEKTNIIAVAQRAGVTKGAIYNNWNNKAELWADVYGKPYVSPEERLAKINAAAFDVRRGVLLAIHFLKHEEIERAMLWAQNADSCLEEILNDK